MAKKKASIGVITFVRDKPRKRPLRHAKKRNKRRPRVKKYRGQGK
jgi:hypothetical protein